MCISTSGFYMGSGNPNTRPHACEVRVLYTKTSSLSANTFCGNIEALCKVHELPTELLSGNHYRYGGTMYKTRDTDVSLKPRLSGIRSYKHKRNPSLPWCLLLTFKKISIPGNVSLEHHSWKTAKNP